MPSSWRPRSRGAPASAASSSSSPPLTLGVLTALNTLNYLDRFVLGAVLPLVLQAFALSDFRGGALQSAFMASYTLVCPLVGIVGERRRRIAVAAAGAFVWSAATMASALAPSYGWLLAARSFIGVGEATFVVITPSLISDLYPPGRRGRALAVFYASIPVGSALGFMLGGKLGATHGWQSAFMVAGSPGLLLGAALLLLREPRRGALDGAQRAGDVRGPAAFARALVRRPSYFFNTAAQTVYTFSMGGLALWLPTYFNRVRGVPLAQASFVFGALLVVAGFAGTLLGGLLGDAAARRGHGAHFSVSGWALLGTLPCSAVALLARDPAIFWPAMFATLLLAFINQGPLNAAMANVLPADLRARGFAVYTFAIHAFGDVPSTMLIGQVSDRMGLFLPVLGGAALLGVAGLILLAGRRALHRDLEAA